LTVPTTRVFRIVHHNYADEPFSGEGGLHAASRWASRGRIVSYASDSLALATLEKIAGAGRLGRLSEMVYLVADLDQAAIQVVPSAELPEGWDRRPPGNASRALGDRFLLRRRSLALCVPSVVLPEGLNYVLNPAHPDFGNALVVRERHPLELDPRVLERLREGGE